MRRPALTALGVVLALLGGLFTLQGLDVLGQDGGMNGEITWVVIGLVIAAIGARLVIVAWQRGAR